MSWRGPLVEPGHGKVCQVHTAGSGSGKILLSIMENRDARCWRGRLFRRMHGMGGKRAAAHTAIRLKHMAQRHTPMNHTVDAWLPWVMSALGLLGLLALLWA